MERYFSTRTKWLVFLFVGSFIVSAVCDSDDDQGKISKIGKATIVERFSWEILDWYFPDEITRNNAISNGHFVPENALPVGIEVWKDKLFVTVPRMKEGIPATLNYISLDEPYEKSPKLRPYPSWHHNVPEICGISLTSVHRIYVDKCDRLWVLDSGTMSSGNTTVQVCPFILYVFDLTTDKVIRQYVVPHEDITEIFIESRSTKILIIYNFWLGRYQPYMPKDILPVHFPPKGVSNTFITNIVVDVGKDGCDDAFAYMSDDLGHGLIVYDWQEHNSWRMNHVYFQSDPLDPDYKITDIKYQRGKEVISGMALSPITVDDYRILFFHPLSSNHEFAVSTKILRDPRFATNNFHEFKALDERYMGQSTSEVMSENGVMLFNLIEQNAVGCWNTWMPYNSSYHGVIAKNDKALIFPADIKIVRGTVWMMSNRMPMFVDSRLNYTDVNFRILTVLLREAIAGTICEDKS